MGSRSSAPLGIYVTARGSVVLGFDYRLSNVIVIILPWSVLIINYKSDCKFRLKILLSKGPRNSVFIKKKNWNSDNIVVSLFYQRLYRIMLFERSRIRDTGGSYNSCPLLPCYPCITSLEQLLWDGQLLWPSVYFRHLLSNKTRNLNLPILTCTLSCKSSRKQSILCQKFSRKFIWR